MKRLNPKWTGTMQEAVANCQPVDQVLSDRVPQQWLIAVLARSGRAFEVYDCGVGVKRITTETKVCPCCKKELEKP